MKRIIKKTDAGARVGPAADLIRRTGAAGSGAERSGKGGVAGGGMGGQKAGGIKGGGKRKTHIGNK
jgi:hypothetical protein